jgi:hypothetical protein
MKRALAIVFVALAAHAAVNRMTLVAVQKNIDRKLELMSEEPFSLLGMTHGLYVEGFGAVFTAEVQLVAAPSAGPFVGTIPKDVVERVHKKKLERLPVLRGAMRELLVSSAASLDTVPGAEQVVLSISLFRQPYEDVTGVPSQIVMQGQRKMLVEYQTQRKDKSYLDAVIKTREF